MDQASEVTNPFAETTLLDGTNSRTACSLRPRELLKPAVIPESAIVPPQEAVAMVNGELLTRTSEWNGARHVSRALREAIEDCASTLLMTVALDPTAIEDIGALT